MIPPREMGFEKTLFAKTAKKGGEKDKGLSRSLKVKCGKNYVKWFLRNSPQNVKCI